MATVQPEAAKAEVAAKEERERRELEGRIREREKEVAAAREAQRQAAEVRFWLVTALDPPASLLLVLDPCTFAGAAPAVVPILPS